MEPLGRGLTAPSVIELAADEVLLAGLVDAHVHVNEPGRTEWEGFASATPGRGRRRGDHDHRHAAQQHRNISPYQGLALAGVVRRTFLRGREVDGSTHGRLLRRGID